MTVANRVYEPGADQGKIPLEISWDLVPGWGADPDNESGCFTAETYTGEVRVDSGDGETVATFAIDAKRGSATYYAPVDTVLGAETFLVVARYTAYRTIYEVERCLPYGSDHTADRQNSVNVPVLYVGEDPCDWTASYVTGRVLVKRADGRTQLLSKGDGIMLGDTVITGKQGKLELRNGASRLRLGPNSKQKLKSAYCAAGGPTEFSWKLFFGRIWTKVSGMAGGGRTFEVETPNAGIGVRGTEFWVDARGKGRTAVTKVRTVSGTVRVQRAGSSRGAVTVRKGRCTTVKASRTPSRAKRCRRL